MEAIQRNEGILTAPCCIHWVWQGAYLFTGKIFLSMLSVFGEGQKNYINIGEFKGESV